jgi:putative ABC transport system ATP-binding protein
MADRNPPLNVEMRKIKVVLPGAREPLFSIRSFDAPAGAKVLIEGPSGRGKTTLLHLIAGLFHPTEGSVEVGGQRLASLSADDLGRLRRQSIGLVFQKLNIVEHLTAEENVLLGLPPRSPGASERARAALAELRLGDKAAVRAGVLSLGEQQRVAVARVLAQRPQILLADEPTSSLDDQNAETVARALARAAGAGTLIAVSHDRRLRPHFAKQISFEELARG